MVDGLVLSPGKHPDEANNWQLLPTELLDRGPLRAPSLPTLDKATCQQEQRHHYHKLIKHAFHFKTIKAVFYSTSNNIQYRNAQLRAL